MSKRKATKSQQGADAAKKPRAGGASTAAAAAAAAASAASSAGDDSLDAAIRHADLIPRIAVQTVKLVNAIEPAYGNYTSRMKELIVVLKADADRAESLVDWSLEPEGNRFNCGCGGQMCVMWLLLRFFSSCHSARDDVYDLADSDSALNLIDSKIVPLLPRLLRSFDPATVSAATGNNALHEMCKFFLMSDEFDWSYQIARQLIVRGVSVHARNKQGRTPLLEYAATAVRALSTANGMHLLLAHGADLNAQDNGGNGVLHHLVKRQALGVLEDLCAGVRGGIDYSLRNSDGHTAADLADFGMMDAAGSGGDSESEETEAEKRARRIYRLLLAQTALWAKHSRPVLLRCLDGVLPVTDLAKLVLAYVDGSGPPFTTAAASASAAMEEENSDDDDDEEAEDHHPSASASAAAAAAAST